MENSKEDFESLMAEMLGNMKTIVDRFQLDPVEKQLADDLSGHLMREARRFHKEIMADARGYPTKSFELV